jgi:hypothetical protein
MIRPGDVCLRAASRVWFSRSPAAASATARPTLEWARVAVAAEDRMRDMGADDDEVEAWFAGLWAAAEADADTQVYATIKLKQPLTKISVAMVLT